MSETFTITRTEQRGKSTLGAMTDENGKHLCWTLEDLQRDEKIDDETAIPTGRYELIARHESIHLDWHSKMFGEGEHPFMLELAKVQNFTGILIHVGNTHENTEGCILVGDNKGVDDEGNMVVWNSRQAYKRVYPLLRDAVDGKDAWIEIVNKVEGGSQAT